MSASEPWLFGGRRISSGCVKDCPSAVSRAVYVPGATIGPTCACAMPQCVMGRVCALWNRGSSQMRGFSGGVVRNATSRGGSYRRSQDTRATLNYTLKSAPKEPVRIEILNSNGETIREMQSTSARAGINRVSWDLRYDPPRLVALRTTPPENPRIWEEPRFHNAQTRPITHWGIAQAQ